MKKIIFLACFFIVNHISAQIIPFEHKDLIYPRVKNLYKQLSEKEQSDYDFFFSEFHNFISERKSVNDIFGFLTTNEEKINNYSSHLKTAIYFDFADEFYYNYDEFNKRFTNLDSDFSIKLLAIYQKAIDCIENEDHKNFIRNCRIDFIEDYVHEQIEYGDYYDYGAEKNVSKSPSQTNYAMLNLMRDYKEIEPKDKTSQRLKEIAEVFTNDFSKTKYIAGEAKNINLGAQFSYGKDMLLGGTIGFGATQAPHAKKLLDIYSRFDFSWLDFSFLHNLSNQSNDFYFGIMNNGHAGPFNANLVQFGFHQGLENVSGVKWFYRPEIGLGFGPFSFCYSYNLTFDKAVREQTNSHMFTLKLSSPIFRIGKYD